MNPFDLKPSKPIEDMMLDWKDLSPRPYKKLDTDPYTKARIILMNGIEVEAVMFGHNFNRNCEDNDLRRDLALLRRIEAGQQKHVNWLSPSDETPLETTIGYEQLAVDLTAWLAMHEPDAYAKSCMDFALLEDFDHLYRYANLLKMDEDLPAHKLVRDTIEITPGRPTVAHHRHPFDSVRAPRNARTINIRTTLGALVSRRGASMDDELHEPGQHAARRRRARPLPGDRHGGGRARHALRRAARPVGHLAAEPAAARVYGNLPVLLVLRDRGRPLREENLGAPLRAGGRAPAQGAELLYKHEDEEWQALIPDGEFPELLDFHPTKDYVREVLAEQVTLTAQDENFVNVDDVPSDFRFFGWNDRVNGRIQDVPSHRVIRETEKQHGEDYRIEDAESPIPELRNRKKDNTVLGRVQGEAKKAHEVEKQAKEEREAVLA